MRTLILIFDMLAGHWEENIIVPSTNLPPPNVIGYVKKGQLFTFQKIIEKGVFVYAWNNGICNTPYGQKYLASGTYRGIKTKSSDNGYWIMKEGIEIETILTACKKKYPYGKVASFGSDAWMQTGWWKAPDVTFGWSSYFSDFITTQTCFKWMMENPDWKMVLLYLAQYDKTGNCFVFKENALYTEDKHHSIIYLDKILWMIKEFLIENKWWNETLLFIGSDHGCHYGCNVAIEEGIQRGISKEEISNYCSNHQEPFDCYMWDFEKEKKTNKKVNCCRRITFIISGGGLPKNCRGKIVKYGEIIDFAPTIAKLMEIDFNSDGKCIL